jgi:acyl carrier protein
MNDIRRLVLDKLADIAPETDPASIDHTADVREALDIDSMDFLRFVTSLHDALQVEIAERDYPALRTIDGAVAYLEQRISSRA